MAEIAAEAGGGDEDGDGDGAEKTPDIIEYLQLVRMDSEREVKVPPAKERPPEHGLESFLEMIARTIFNRSSTIPEGEEYNMPRVLKVMTAAFTRVG